MATATTRKSAESRAADLTKFAVEGEVLWIRNTLDSIVTHNIPLDGGREAELKWSAKGDPLGEDVQEVPSIYLKNVQFRKVLQKGILEIEDADNDGVLSAVEAQKAAWEATKLAKQESDRMVQAQLPRAFSGTQCLAQEGRNQCSEFAISSQNNREKPPLCQKHVHLSSQFAPEETGKFTDGKPEVRWIRASIQQG